LVEPMLSLAREQRDSERECVLHLGRHLGQHREASAYVESADSNLDSGGAQLARDIDCACELVGLHSDQEHDAAVRVALKSPNYSTHRHFRVGLVVRIDIEIDALAEDVPRLRVEREAVEVRQRTGRHEAAPPLNEITVVVVMRGFDQLDEELCARFCIHHFIETNTAPLYC